MSGTRDLCHQSAIAFMQGDPGRAVAVLKPYWPIPEEEIDGLAYQSQQQMQAVTKRFGAARGVEYVGEERAGDSFLRHTFIGKFERHAVRYLCLFYKPESEWVVNAVNWDDSVEQLFD